MTTPTATPAQLVTLRDRISRILIGETCGRIGFVLAVPTSRPGGFTVIGMSIATATASRRGHGDRRRWASRCGKCLTASAPNTTQSNTIRVPSADHGRTLDDRNGIVHEATHAIYDYFRIRATALEEEAGAYIAGAMYTGWKVVIIPPSARRFSASPGKSSARPGGATPAHAPVDGCRLTGAAAAVGQCHRGESHVLVFRRHRTERYTHDGGRI